MEKTTDRIEQLLNMELRTPKGMVDKHLDSEVIRERIYQGVYKGNEQVRFEGGNWQPMVSWPEFQQVLRLVGVDIDALKLQVGLRSAKAPTAASSARQPDPTEKPSKPVSVGTLPTPQPGQSARPMPEPEKAGLPILPIAIAVVGGGILLLWLLS